MSNKIQLPPISNLLKQQDMLEPVALNAPMAPVSAPVSAPTSSMGLSSAASPNGNMNAKNLQDRPKLAPLLQPILPTLIQPSVTAPSNFPAPQQMPASLPPPSVPGQVFPGQQVAPPQLYTLPTPTNSSPSNTPPLNATNLYYYLYPSYLYTYQNGQPVVATMAPGPLPQGFSAGNAPGRAPSSVIGLGGSGLPMPTTSNINGAKPPLVPSNVSASVNPYVPSGESTSVSPSSQGAGSPSMISPRDRKPSLGNMPLDKTRKTRSNLPKETTFILLKWLNEHLNHPYPNSFEKNQLMLSTGLNQQQLSNWFINARRRKIKLLKEQTRINSV